MPGKKKKYNARFPPARIKKIMQSDEEVGKVAAPVPVIISRTLELFVQSLLTRAGEITVARQARTLTPSHLKTCIMAEQRFDFLQEIFSNVPDIGPETDVDMPTPPVSVGEIFQYPRTVPGLTSSGREPREPVDVVTTLKENSTSGRGRGRGRGRPRKTEKSEILPKRPRGRPRKIQSYICHEEEDDDDADDSENGLEIESSEEESENEVDVFDTHPLCKQSCPKVCPQANMNTLNCSVDLSVKNPSASSSCVMDGGIHITIPSLGTSLQPLVNAGNNNLSGIPIPTIQNTNNTEKSVISPPPPTFKIKGPSGSPALSKDLSNNTNIHGYGTYNGTSGIPVPVITSLESVSKMANSRPMSCSSQTGIDEDYDC